MLDRFFNTLVLAQEGLDRPGQPAPGSAAPADAGATGGAAAGQEGGGTSLIIMMVVMLAVFYFLLIRPQQKRAKKHKDLVEGLKKGDTVITQSGIFGKIVGFDGNAVTLEIAKNTRVKVLKSFVGGRATAETEQELAQAQTT